MLIKVRTEYTKELILKYGRFNEFSRTSQIVTYIIMELIMFSLALIFIFTSENRVDLIISIFVLMPFLILIIPIVIYRLPLIALKNSKNKIGTINTYEFSEDEIIIDSTLPNLVGQTKANYNYFERIYETKDEFYLYVSKVQAFVIRKSEVSEENISELRELFKKKLPSYKYNDKPKGHLFMPVFMSAIFAVFVLVGTFSFFM